MYKGIDIHIDILDIDTDINIDMNVDLGISIQEDMKVDSDTGCIGL